MMKAIFITGGGSGIGRATAEYFAAKGWFVGLADVNAAGMAETAALLPAGGSSSHILDVRDREQWDRVLAEFTEKTDGRIDLLFNNAGIGAGGPLSETPTEEIDRIIDINLKGVFYGAQAGFKYLKATAGSALVNTSSAAGLYASPRMSSYAATKFGVRAMTQSLDQEWAEHGIKVRAIMPGFIDTPLLDVSSTGSNLSIREMVRAAGLEFTPVEKVAEAVWKAAHGNHTFLPIGKTARKIAFLARWAPGLLMQRGRTLAKAAGPGTA
ncbi:SDR family oxidoreductase [Sphingomonas paeninsulae]|uniref:SDR family oxidoreductase n=1 Tax=Sphingomonas paeninsulae TaxID=2319844 RepID=A0A494TA26_SPHPE|nr:SDR family oxidoreductase [Sphingomonas paeninsulae]AYJ86279.1 SDR family oxidoreductase [Sphingomonas paeninsulae]